MKETGIIMSGNHPKLILDGIKTQTRRVIKPQPPYHPNIQEPLFKKCILHGIKGKLEYWLDEHTGKTIYCPYGQVGDRLWVRETCFKDNLENWRYKADEALLPMTANYTKREVIPSIFMPRWASRITLEITEVRVERVQDITAKDALAEGIEYKEADDKGFPICTPDVWFHILWDSLNFKRGYGWDANPWVWIIGFRRIEL